jgi:hypothetical protein
MKLQILGVKNVSGTAKESGNPFTICRLFAMTPIENGGGGKVTVIGYGFELSEIELDEQALDSFKTVNFPTVLDLETDVRSFMGKMQTIVVGYKGAPKAVASA